MNKRNTWNEEQIELLWTKAQAAALSRRRFLFLLATGGAAAVVAACAPSAPSPQATSAPTSVPLPTANAPTAAARAILKPTPEQYFILYGTNAEMRFEVMAGRGYTMPNSLFFVRSHDATPQIDPHTWRLSVRGDGIEKPFELSYDELLKLPSHTFTRYVECAGNGRSFFDTLLKKPAQGTQWKLGAYGIAAWTGVPLAELLNRARVKKSAVDVMPTGLDRPKIERPIPIAKAMEEDTLLVYAMNGDLLLPDHGFPARLLVPGWVGINNIKWVGAITVSEKPIFVDKNTNSYVLIGPDYQAQPPAKGPILTTMNVKSAVALPFGGVLLPGPQKIEGYAWSAFGKIAKVEISVDGGKSYQPATLVGPNIERAGTRWEFMLDARLGDLTIIPRATDEQGNVQLELSQQKWNEQGYLFGAVVPHPLKVSNTITLSPTAPPVVATSTPTMAPAASGAKQPAGLLAASGKNVYASLCQNCHGAEGQGNSAPALIGPKNNLGPRYGNAQNLYDYIRQNMPTDKPDSLTPQQAFEATAFILLENQYVTADMLLDVNSLGSISLKK